MVPIFLLLATSLMSSAEALKLDERPAEPGDWGYRPEERSRTAVNPPSFVWRPQKGAQRYLLQVSRSPRFDDVVYERRDLTLAAHCPSETFAPGEYFWRFAYVDQRGQRSYWSHARGFTVPADAKPFPMPERAELLSRIPTSHPRLFVRPEQLPELRALAQGKLKPIANRLVEECERIVADPPPTAEPRKYPEGIERGSDPWREIWWGNRRYTIRLLNGAATLAFTRLILGRESYGQLARELLMAAAEWDPKGATGYRYNDEAGMPYNYYFSRTYTFVHDLLTEEERQKCREVMRIRGQEMYEHLQPRHLWRPYASHSNRAWHFLGEIGIAFLDEIEDARDWVWFAMNVFYNTYPVWSDDDGGWHEGLAYWRSYINRFLWWADIMRVAMRVDAYEKPYFSQVGYFPMYLQPPGTKRGGFGDLCANLRSKDNVGLMAIFAAQAQNPYWQWYVEAHGGAPPGDGYVDFIRGALPSVPASPPVDLPSSRAFWGTGLAMLHTDLTDARKDVFIEFKSSPFGSQSHGYDAQNSFVLYAYSEPIFIRTGRRDSYGSQHHRYWQWETKSVNSILVNGEGQKPHTVDAQGKLVAFGAGPNFDYVVGEAAGAYPGTLEQFTRHILFIKPGTVLIYDQLKAPEPSTYQWLLHAPTEMQIAGEQQVQAMNGEAGCQVQFLYPQGLALSQTDQFDPPPRPRIKLTQWHLQAATVTPTVAQEFVTLLRPHRADTAPDGSVEFQQSDAGYACRVSVADGQVIVLFRRAPGDLEGYGLRTEGDVAALMLDSEGHPGPAFLVGAGGLSYAGESISIGDE